MNSLLILTVSDISFQLLDFKINLLVRQRFNWVMVVKDLSLKHLNFLIDLIISQILNRVTFKALLQLSNLVLDISSYRLLENGGQTKVLFMRVMVAWYLQRCGESWYSFGRWTYLNWTFFVDHYNFSERFCQNVSADGVTMSSLSLSEFIKNFINIRNLFLHQHIF